MHNNIVANYKKYLDENQMIGFTKSFPVKKIIESETFDVGCLGYKEKLSVHLAEVSFGEKQQYSCLAIVTDRLRVADKLPPNFVGHYAFHDEAKVMESSIVAMANKHGYWICTKICSWPFAKVIVTKITEAYLK